MRTRTALLAALAAVALPAGAAQGVATFSAQIRAELEIVPRLPDMVSGEGAAVWLTSTQERSELPSGDGLSFSGDTSALALGIAQSVFVEAEASGRVERGVDLRGGTAETRALGYLGLINAGDEPVRVDLVVRVREWRVSGSVENDASEFAEAIVSFGFNGEVDLGFPEPLPLTGPLSRHSTRDGDPPRVAPPPVADEFELLGVPFTRTYSLLVPPSFTERRVGGETVLEIQPWDIGLAVTAGGAVRNAGGLASEALTSVPDLPESPPFELESAFPKGCGLTPNLTHVRCLLQTPLLTLERRFPARLVPGQAFLERWILTPRQGLAGTVRVTEDLPAGFRALGGRPVILFTGLEPGQRATRTLRLRAGEEPGLHTAEAAVRFRRETVRRWRTLTLGSVFNLPDPMPAGPVEEPGPVPGPAPPAGLPDLVVSFLDGDSVTVANQGESGAGAFLLTLTGTSANGTFPLASISVSGLPAGGSASYGFTCPALTGVTAVADSAGQVSEASEQNNSRSFQVGSC